MTKARNIFHLIVKIALASLNLFNPLRVFWLGLLAVCCLTIVESVGSQLANFTPPPPLPFYPLAPTHEKNEAELDSSTVMALI